MIPIRNLMITRKRARTIWMALAVIAVVIIAALYLRVPERSFAIQATTHGARIEFSGSASKPWLIPELTICRRTGARVSPGTETDGLAPSAAPCDRRLFETHTVTGAIVNWPDGVSAGIRRDARHPLLGLRDSLGGGDTPEGGDLGVTVSIDGSQEHAPGDALFDIGGVTVSAGSLLILSEPVLEQTGNLLFSGVLTLGNEPSSGVKDHLEAGTYQVRERLAFRDRPVEVLSGQFFRGDTVTIMAPTQDRPVPVTGFFAPSSDFSGGLDLVAYSTPDDSAIEVFRPGTVPSIIVPSWADRALNDPLVLGLTALLALVLVVVELIIGVHGVLSGRAFKGD